MSKERRFHGAPNPNSVVIGSYPSCKHCLTWSDEGLAVAAGANVYLVNKPDNGFSRDGSVCPTTIIRVDQFTHAEWPEQPLATIKDLSLGEEQSDSAVVSLAWSPPGLGIHRRSVLAVLTSNLLLSLWETDGSLSGWQRTGVINHYLQEEGQAGQTRVKADRNRRQSRVRAFAWCAPLHINKHHRWGSQCLIAADDDRNLIVLSIVKSGRGEYGKWDVSVVCSTPLPSTNARATYPATKLQAIIGRSSQVDRLTVTDWQTEEYDAHHMENPKTTAQATILCELFHQPTPSTMLVDVSWSGKVIEGVFRVPSANVSQYLPADFDLGSTNIMTAPQKENCTIVHSVKAIPEWREALEPICTEYRARYGLGELYRVRYWGFATSPMETLEAACVTLHPRDMFEYTSAANEKSWILFRILKVQTIASTSVNKNNEEVFRLVFEFILRLIRNGFPPRTSLDRKLLRVLQAQARLTKTFTSELDLLESLWNKHNEVEDTSSTVSAQRKGLVNAPITPPALATTEMCDVCNSNISVQTAVQEAVCTSGHSFLRCSVSGIAIQEPGISKFCSMCDRQFLNLPKLEPHDAESLIWRLFDEFDICPYCDGKYRS